jgi:hypothetical protein
MDPYNQRGQRNFSTLKLNSGRKTFEILRPASVYDRPHPLPDQASPSTQIATEESERTNTILNIISKEPVMKTVLRKVIPMH